MKYAIVLAAGRGTRMKSGKNKVMHEILGKPMIAHLTDHLRSIDMDEIVVVTGYQHELVQEYLGNDISYAYQDEQIGTGDDRIYSVLSNAFDTLIPRMFSLMT